jgi:hypothetical protein
MYKELEKFKVSDKSFAADDSLEQVVMLRRKRRVLVYAVADEKS